MPSLRTLFRSPRPAPVTRSESAGDAMLEMSSALVFGLQAMDREMDLGGHAERVAALADRMAAANGVSAELRAVLRKAALLHEVGMIAVPRELLHRGAPLTAEEMGRLHAHAELGATIAGATCGELAATIIRHQHHDEAGLRERLGEGTDAYALTMLLRAADVADVISRPRPGNGPAEHGLHLREPRATLTMDPATAEAYVAAMAA